MKLRVDTKSSKDIVRKCEIILRTESVFDASNHKIVFCDHELESILNVGAFHVEQLRSLAEEVAKKNTEEEKMGGKRSSIKRRRSDIEADTDEPEPKRCKRLPHLTKTYRMEDDLFNLLKASVNKSCKQEGVSYQYVAKLISKYIIARKKSLFDYRNIYVANVLKDPLGKVFGVQAFHRNQARRLILSKLVEVRQ